MSSRSSSEWQERFRAPTLTLPEWSRHAPDRAVPTSGETGSLPAHALGGGRGGPSGACAWAAGSGERRRVTDEHVGVIYATVSADGREAIWFSDPTGDESGRWMAIPFGGGDAREILPGAPVGWPDGLAVGLRVVAGVLADRDGFAVYVARGGGPAEEILRDVDALSIGGTDFHVEGTDVAVACGAGWEGVYRTQLAFFSPARQPGIVQVFEVGPGGSAEHLAEVDVTLVPGV